MKRRAQLLIAFAALTTLTAAGAARAQLTPDLSSYFGTDTAGQAPTINASPVDLLVDSTSYVPPFYRGRRLPSPGSVLHLEAIAHFKNSGGAPIPETDIVYTWTRNGRVEGSVSGAGRPAVSLPAPSLFATDVISVDAHAADNSAFGSASVTVPSIDPGIILYQDHPLFGVEYYDAVVPGTIVSDVEMTFAAIPYFISAPGPNDPRLSYVWQVNGQTVAATSSNASEITVNASGSSGLAALALSLTSPANVLLDAQGSWNILFSRQGLLAPSNQ